MLVNIHPYSLLLNFYLSPTPPDTGAPDDSTELSFAKGEVLDILTTSEQWWDARTMDGRKGGK